MCKLNIAEGFRKSRCRERPPPDTLFKVWFFVTACHDEEQKKNRW